MIGVDKSTVSRQRVRLQKLGLVIKEGGGRNRKLWPWWQYAARLARAGDTAAVDRLLAKALQRPIQGNVFEQAPAEQPPAPRVPVCPSPEAIEAYVLQTYGCGSFFDLPQREQIIWTQRWALQNVGDLAWLFAQEITPSIYQKYKALKPQEKNRYEKHAPRYAWGNRDNPDFMMRLSKYLNPYDPGYAQPLRDRASRKLNKTGRSGFSAEQAQYLAQQATAVDTDDFLT
jgi:hypothetical protein